MRGISRGLRTAGYTMLVASADEDPDLERDAIQALAQRRVDGLIIAPTTAADPRQFEEIEASGIPVVVVDRAVANPLDQVRVENVQSVARSVGQILDAGHTRVAIIGGRPNHSSTQERIAGWRRAHTARGLPCDESLAVLNAADAEQARWAALSLLDRPDPPTAFFSTTNVRSLGVLRALKDRGLSVPEDLSFVGFDDIEWTDLLDHPLSCLAQPTQEIGQRAVELLMARISQPDSPHLTVKLDPTFHDRGSITRPRR